MMTDLSSLIERLEKADGPDDALDRDILKALGARLAWDWTWGAWFGDERFCATNLTASLDAALALCERVLPAGWCGNVDWGVRMPSATLKHVGLDMYVAFAATPPLALCLALLRALSQKESSNA